MGARQIFIRFAGCNLACRYCDTNFSRDGGPCRLEITPGRRDYIELANPLSWPQLLTLLGEKFNAAEHHSVSITGGEPLIQADFLEELLPGIKEMGLPVYLETNGTLPQELSRIIGAADIVAMDIKLPGNTGCGPLWDRHHQFLTIARQAQVFVKIVMDDLTDSEEYLRAVRLVYNVDPAITTVIQPVTREGKCLLSPERALALQSMALKLLRDVRVIPQAHVMMGQL